MHFDQFNPPHHQAEILVYHLIRYSSVATVSQDVAGYLLKITKFLHPKIWHFTKDEGHPVRLHNDLSCEVTRKVRLPVPDGKKSDVVLPVIVY